eukprot:TRINITY_DN9668_c0_g2_i1.p1 TRINITY_DN9668_c0_g2~~TRINITY_DN9668_c0_g2_i1.p1  ORF type:complete len:241 (-),score=29.52 TRINITY_DN9668_c0_g2_i1:206-928(-)
MIHCFNACGAGCRCLSQGCSGACSGLGVVCDCLVSPCKWLGRVLDRPLGWYVLFTTLWLLSSAACAFIAIASDEVSYADFSVDSLMTLCISIGVLCIVHITMTLYVQRRLAYGFAEDTGSMTGMDDGRPSSAELMRRAGKILLYDVVFCMYLIVFIGGFCWSWYGFVIIGRAKPESTLPMIALVLEVSFYFFSVSCFSLWSCGNCCDAYCCSMFRRGSSRRSIERSEPVRGTPRMTEMVD